MDWDDMRAKSAQWAEMRSRPGDHCSSALHLLSAGSASRVADMPATTRPPLRLILASASPRRRQLLEEAGYRFEVEPADIDEHLAARGITCDHLPELLAQKKADAVAERHAGEAVVVLAADTIVYSAQGEVIGKPVDKEDARRIIRTLAGTLHSVVTGFCCVRCKGNGRRVGSARSEVLMRPLSAAEIETYLATGHWQGKAGAYGIQDTPGMEIGAGDPFIERIGGELTNIVGLPMPQVIDALEDLGVIRHS